MREIVSLTWFLLAAFEGVVDVDKGEVVALGMLELHVTAHHFCYHANGRLDEAAWC